VGDMDKTGKNNLWNKFATTEFYRNEKNTFLGYLTLLKKHWWKFILTLALIILVEFLSTNNFIDKIYGFILIIVFIIILFIAFITYQFSYVKTFSIADFVTQSISLIILLLLLFTYIYSMQYNNSGVINQGGIKITEFNELLYFSGVTFFSLGYGDYTPTGVYKYVAIFEVFCEVIIIANLISFGLATINENKRQAEWKPIRDEAEKLVKVEIKNTGIIVRNLFTYTSAAVALPAGATVQQTNEIFDNSHKEDMKHLTKLSDNALAELFSYSKEQKYIFNDEKKELNNIEIKYGSHLTVESRMQIMKLQNQLYAMASSYDVKALLSEQDFKQNIAKRSKEILSEVLKTF
jgi:hypothetical protein